VFEGEGIIKDFPGNYSEFREWEKEQKAQQKDKAAAPVSSNKEEPAKNGSTNRASFKQKQEFEQIQHDMATLEKEKQQLVEQISQGSDDHERLLSWSTRVQEIDGQLGGLELRWLELSELEGIE